MTQELPFHPFPPGHLQHQGRLWGSFGRAGLGGWRAPLLGSTASAGTAAVAGLPRGTNGIILSEGNVGGRNTCQKRKNGFGCYWSFIFCVNLPILTGENISKGRQRISVPQHLSQAQQGPGILQLCTSHGKGILCHISL